MRKECATQHEQAVRYGYVRLNLDRNAYANQHTDRCQGQKIGAGGAQHRPHDGPIHQAAAAMA